MRPSRPTAATMGVAGAILKGDEMDTMEELMARATVRAEGGAGLGIEDHL